MAYLEQFPEWFVLECKMTLTDKQFFCWFEDYDEYEHVGFATIKIRDSNAFRLTFQGQDYLVCHRHKVNKDVRFSLGNNDGNFYTEKVFEAVRNGFYSFAMDRFLVRIERTNAVN